MNIKDFLIENYIWILVIILITIITIIGFLADKKKNGKKNNNQSVPEQNPNTGQLANNIAPIQYNNPEQFMQNQMNNNSNMGMTTANFNNQISQQNQVNNMQNIPNINNGNNMVNNNMPPLEPISTQPTSVNTNTMNNNPSVVDNVVPKVNPEPMYQPLSEQKPVISPRPVPNFNSMPQSNQNIINPIENALNSNNMNMMSSMGQTNINQNNGIQEQMINHSNINTMPNYNNASNPMPGTINMQNYGQNTTIPEPINVIPTPQPVNPQPIMTGTYNNNSMMQQNNSNQQMPNSNINQQQGPMQTTPFPNQPINFVYGPQNTNQNM